jgi:D-glycero-alpha-D-manno-heptose-7-phosphate kinase
VTVAPIACDYAALESHLLLLYTGAPRQGDAGQMLAVQRQDRDDVRELVTLADRFATALAAGDLRRCGVILESAWSIKRRFIADPQIDAWYDAARKAGVWGGKLCGAGGGGFLLFLAPPERHGAIMQALGLRHVAAHIVLDGSMIIHVG